MVREIKAIPEPTLRRLPIYYHYLSKLTQGSEADCISCTQIADDLKLIPIQVRKDLEITGALGKPKVGYNVAALKKIIADFLGWNNMSDAFLVGAGHLGQALLGYQGFKDYGLNIAAAFDVDPKKVGKEIQGKKILHVYKLPGLAKRMNVQIGILTAPAHAAQELASLMIDAGIKAIWNFAAVRLVVPDGVIVQHENLASSLAVLSKRIATKQLMNK